MIRNPKNGPAKANIFLKDGTEYLGRDVVERTFGEHDRMVGFWNNDVLVCIPMSEVKRVEFIFEP